MTIPTGITVRDRATGRVGTVRSSGRISTTDGVVHGTRGHPRNSRGSVYVWFVRWADGSFNSFPVHGRGNLVGRSPRWPGHIPTPHPPVAVDNSVLNVPGFEPWNATPPRLEIIPGS